MPDQNHSLLAQFPVSHNRALLTRIHGFSVWGTRNKNMALTSRFMCRALSALAGLRVRTDLPPLQRAVAPRSPRELRQAFARSVGELWREVEIRDRGSGDPILLPTIIKPELQVIR